MDSLSSSGTAISSTATVPKSVSKQLTYTTAGTLYKPASAQPLQPPTRRGRSFKWAPGGANSNLALLPKSFLATLPLRTGTGRASASQQYTPLQQNYDRAVGPLGDLDHVSVNMSANPPRILSGNTPSSVSSLLSNFDRDNYAEEDSSESSDSDSDFGMDPLMNMTVKSLHSLASYPNPSQKKARKVLLRGVKPALEGMPASAKANPPPVQLNRSLGQTEILKKSSVSPISLRPVRSDPLSLRKVQGYDGTPKPDLHRSSTVQINNSQHKDLGDKTSSSLSGSTSASMTLASGPGAPQPLTAGPPGQRQYRPSTFESTFKALQTKAQSPNNSQEDDTDILALSQHTLLQAGIDDIGLLSDPAFVSKLAEPPKAEPQSMALLKQIDPSVLDVSTGEVDQYSNSFLWCSEYPCLNAMYWSTWSYWSSEPYYPNRNSVLSISPERYKPGTDRLTETEIAARNEKINREWYAGIGFLGKGVGEVADDGSLRKPENKFGVIGEGRPIKTKAQYPLMKITEANHMTTAEHAKPLMGIAYASVLRHVEADLCNVDMSQLEKKAEGSCGQVYGHIGGQNSQ